MKRRIGESSSSSMQRCSWRWRGGGLVEIEGEELGELGCEVVVRDARQVVGHVRSVQRRLQQSTRHVGAGCQCVVSAAIISVI